MDRIYFYIDGFGSEQYLSDNPSSTSYKYEFDKCNIPESRRCPESTRWHQHSDYGVDWQGDGYVSCTSSNSSNCNAGYACLDYNGYQGGSYADTCVSSDSTCYCGAHGISRCWVYCSYAWTVQPSSGTTGLSTTRYGSPPSGLGQGWHGGTVSYTCEPNGCGIGGEVSAFVSITVGKTRPEDNVDGCSQGTNCSIYTAPASDYDVDINWCCDGNQIGEDRCITDKPYKCHAGSTCAGRTIEEIDSSCRRTGTTDCSPDEMYCKEGSSDCVECLEDTHCPGSQVCTNNQCVSPSCTGHSDCNIGDPTIAGSSGEYCSACSGVGPGTCSGTGTCQACTWASNKWCKSEGDKVVRNCKANDVSRRRGTVEICTNGCSGASCN